MRLVFAGTPEVAVPSLRALVVEHDVVGVITRQDAPVGRKQTLTPSPVAQVASELGLPVRKANRLGQDDLEWLETLAPELGVIVAYGGLLKSPILETPERGWVNLHFSTLPKWRGAAPVQRALMAGETRLGVTVFQLVEALDAGDILARDSREFPPGTSAGEALETLATFGTETLLRAIAGLSDGSIVAAPQEGEATYAHKLHREDGVLDLTQPADIVLARWAGVTPEPGASVAGEGGTLKILELAPVDDPPHTEAPGTAVMHGKRAVLCLRDGALELVRVQPAGKKPMAGADWLRGRGSRLALVPDSQRVAP